jgi:hypothetical protein
MQTNLVKFLGMTTYLLGWKSGQPCGERAGPWVELVNEQTWKFVMLAEAHGVLKIFFSLCRKPTNNIRSDGDARNASEQKTRITRAHNEMIATHKLQCCGQSSWL